MNDTIPIDKQTLSPNFFKTVVDVTPWKHGSPNKTESSDDIKNLVETAGFLSPLSPTLTIKHNLNSNIKMKTVLSKIGKSNSRP